MVAKDMAVQRQECLPFSNRSPEFVLSAVVYRGTVLHFSADTVR